jgi:hypothetical protein
VSVSCCWLALLAGDCSADGDVKNVGCSLACEPKQMDTAFLEEGCSGVSGTLPMGLEVVLQL